MSDVFSPVKIWYQSFIDAQQQHQYFSRLQAYLTSIADPHVRFEVQGISPPDHALHRLTEFRCAAQVIRNAVEAQQQGYDAFLIGHFQDSGLYETRSTIDIPVVSLGEVSMLYACTLGHKIALVTIDPIFIPMHEEQVTRYGLSQRVVAIRAIKTSVADYIAAFTDPRVYQEVLRQFTQQVEPLVEAGIEVIILAGGLPMLLFLHEQHFRMGNAVVLNGIAVAAKMAEVAVKMRRLNGTETSRAATFVRPPEVALQEFLQRVT